MQNMKVDANEIHRLHGEGALLKALDAPRHPREDLRLASWLKRDLPLRDYLLGNVICTTSRLLLYGDTGIGKTLLMGDIGGAIASGRPFLDWAARRPARVMYLDGEMPAETFKERMELIAAQYGAGIPFFGYCRDALSDGQMPPLNTPEGEQWLMREIELTQPEFIAFDSVMCLLTGSMAEEESWAPVKLLIRKISSKRIGQGWLHHTGHNTSQSFGTKTREWEMDTVVSLTTAQDGQGVLLDFKKARLRTPKTADEFRARIIVRGENGWSATEAEIAKPSTGRRSEQGNLKTAILAAYDRLADGVSTSPGLNDAPVRKVSADKLRDELKSRGYLEKDDKGNLTSTARSHLTRAKTSLFSAGRLIEVDGFLWKP
jgi:hypothetical protein